MTVALYGVAGLLAALLVFSAGMKLTGRADVVESYARVGVERRRLPLLATVLFAGAAGLLVGLAWTPLGIAAAGALACYFILALIAHATHDDLAHAAPPTVLLLLAIGSTVLFALDL
jgi:hypothetical protein